MYSGLQQNLCYTWVLLDMLKWVSNSLAPDDDSRVASSEDSLQFRRAPCQSLALYHPSAPLALQGRDPRHVPGQRILACQLNQPADAPLVLADASKMKRKRKSPLFRQTPQMSFDIDAPTINSPAAAGTVASVVPKSSCFGSELGMPGVVLKFGPKSKVATAEDANTFDTLHTFGG
ncbi:hypothetical protein B0H11DRAFT_1912827 [Mycena galericulata]|nr:hypothetical protein B0H11DRAFT_1912827 [Mycena galericulata]